MSEENVRLFLESSEAGNRGDTEKWLEAFDPECVFEPQVAVVDGAFEGHVGLRAFSQTVGRGSGIRQEQPLAIVARFRNGRITHFKDFGNTDEALEAAGLSE